MIANVCVATLEVPAIARKTIAPQQAVYSLGHARRKRVGNPRYPPFRLHRSCERGTLLRAMPRRHTGVKTAVISRIRPESHPKERCENYETYNRVLSPGLHMPEQQTCFSTVDFGAGLGGSKYEHFSRRRANTGLKGGKRNTWERYMFSGWIVTGESHAYRYSPCALDLKFKPSRGRRRTAKTDLDGKEGEKHI